jgi:serine protease inhibitor
MKRLIINALMLFLLFLIFSCKRDENLSIEPVYIQLNLKSKALLGSSNEFGINLFRTLNSSAKTSTENIMVSPLSISLALSMTYNGANGDTKTAMENTLKLNNLTIDEININFKQVSEALLNVDNSVELSIANSIWYRNTFSVLPDFITVNRDFYNAQINPLNFDDPNSINAINNWVSNNTNHKIVKIIDEISPQNVMFLINAIYFKGIWKYEFDATKNINQLFTLSTGTTKQVEMMVQKSNLKYLNTSNLQMVELPYGQGNWVMDLVLPASDKSIDQIINELTISDWNLLLNSFIGPTEVTINLPPFKFEFESELNDVLKSMGMGIAFDVNSADFSKINKDYQLYISKVKHKTYIEVNERGTEAAAATSVGISNTSIGDQRVVIFDRPFMFVIREVSTGVILFAGKVENPVK